MKIVVKKGTGRNHTLVDLKLTGVTEGELLSLIHALHYHNKASPVAGDVLGFLLEESKKAFEEGTMRACLEEIPDPH